MKEDNRAQLELFKLSQENSVCARAKNNLLFKYQKRILLVIGFLITGMIAFSAGFEKGKKSGFVKFESSLDLASGGKTLYLHPAPAANKPAPIIEKNSAQEKAKIDSADYKKIDNQQSYTIQIASYRTEESAKKEAEKLRKKGLSTSVVPKGKYKILCVGNFTDKAGAVMLLSQMKKKYGDCFIRRL